MQMICKWASN